MLRCTGVGSARAARNAMARAPDVISAISVPGVIVKRVCRTGVSCGRTRRTGAALMEELERDMDMTGRSRWKLMDGYAWCHWRAGTWSQTGNGYGRPRSCAGKWLQTGDGYRGDR